MRQQCCQRRHARNAMALKARRLKFHRGHMRLYGVKKFTPPLRERLRWIKPLKYLWKSLHHRVHANAHRRAAALYPRIKKIGWVIASMHAFIIEARIDQ